VSPFHREPLPYRIRKLHGTWCLQRHTKHTVVKDGQLTTFLLWEFISAHEDHEKAIRALDFLLEQDQEYPPELHHKEPCS
jgi:hypothetical protein